MAAINSFNFQALAEAIATAAGNSPTNDPKPVYFDVTDKEIVKVTTDTDGTQWVDGPDIEARVVVVRNDTSNPTDPSTGGAILEMRFDGAGESIRHNINSAEPVTVINNANELSFRRVDQSNTPVTFSLVIYR